MRHLKNWHPKRRVDGKGSRSNEERADSAQAALSAYLQAKGQRPEADDLTGELSDLLADLFHYAASEGIYLENNILTARMHFDAER